MSGHRVRIDSVRPGRETLWRAVCDDGCNAFMWRNVKRTAQADARRHAADTTEAETYRSMGGTDF